MCSSPYVVPIRSVVISKMPSRDITTLYLMYYT